MRSKLPWLLLPGSLLPGSLLLCGMVSAQGPGATPAPPTGASAGSSTGAPASASPASQPSQEEAVRQLIADVRRAHLRRPGKQFHGFVGTLQVTPSRPDADSVVVNLDVRFELPKRIRYRLVQEGQNVEYGLDADGGWARLGPGEPPRDLSGKDFETDRHALYDRIRLCRQLLRFLEPAEVIGKLRETRLDRAELRLKRGLEIRCRTISGDIDEFPLYLTQGDSGPAHLTLYFDADSSRLVAVQAMPIGKNGRIHWPGERIRMPSYQVHDGVLLPSRLLFDVIEGGQRPRQEMRVQITALTLDPSLSERDFDRTERW